MEIYTWIWVHLGGDLIEIVCFLTFEWLSYCGFLYLLITRNKTGLRLSA